MKENLRSFTKGMLLAGGVVFLFLEFMFALHALRAYLLPLIGEKQTFAIIASIMAGIAGGAWFMGYERSVRKLDRRILDNNQHYQAEIRRINL